MLTGAMARSPGVPGYRWWRLGVTGPDDPYGTSLLDPGMALREHVPVSRRLSTG
jgi:hypothetical protein